MLLFCFRLIESIVIATPDPGPTNTDPIIKEQQNVQKLAPLSTKMQPKKQQRNQSTPESILPQSESATSNVMTKDTFHPKRTITKEHSDQSMIQSVINKQVPCSDPPQSSSSSQNIKLESPTIISECKEPKCDNQDKQDKQDKQQNLSQRESSSSGAGLKLFGQSKSASIPTETQQQIGANKLINYPNSQFSPYGSPNSSPRSNRKRQPLKECRRVSIENSGMYMQLNQYKLMGPLGQVSKKNPPTKFPAA